ncbi:MAG: sulfotransferase [Henriciella sp.]|nr:sulfotransferase [Henriciella sp.]
MSTSGSVQSQISSARDLAQSGDLSAAITLLEKVLRDHPELFQARLLLGKYLFEDQAYAKAVEHVRISESHDPLSQDFGQIQQHMQNRSFGAAEQVARQMLSKVPGHPRAVFTIAHVAGLKNYPEGQVAALKHGLDVSPANLTLRNLLVGALDQVGDYQGAIDAAHTLVRTSETFETLWVLVNILLRHAQHTDLLAICDRAEKLSGGDPQKLSEIEVVRGQTLRVLGQREDSITAYRKGLALNRNNAGAWWALADMKTFDFDGGDRTEIERLLNVPELPSAMKSVAAFALAKASEAKGDWDASMALYHQANRLSTGKQFDPALLKREIDARSQAFDAGALKRQARRPETGPTPIFILGLPRSGSTLIEQILASHSQIEGTIEQPTFPSIARKANVRCALDFKGDLMRNARDLSEDALFELGQAYIEEGALYRSEGAAYFTDKLPFNYRHIGLIHKVLPHAVIIDARRNPMDCGFSLYRQHFPAGVDFSYDLRHIGAFYNSYLSQMDHWNDALPGRVLTLQHEVLVRNPEETIRALLEHVGVAFEDNCLRFHQTERAVRTASSEQVRQPINAKGVGTWRKVETHLEPLRDSLGPATLKRFEDSLSL